MADELPNVVGLRVDSCVQTTNGTTFTYQYEFTVTLPPPDGSNYPAPSFAAGGNLAAALETDPFDPSKFQLVVNYNSIIPTEILQDPPPSGYLTYHGIPYTLADQTVDFTEGTILFIGINTTPQGVRVRAKGSVPVTKSTP